MEHDDPGTALARADDVQAELVEAVEQRCDELLDTRLDPPGSELEQDSEAGGERGGGERRCRPACLERAGRADEAEVVDRRPGWVGKIGGPALPRLLQAEVAAKARLELGQELGAHVQKAEPEGRAEPLVAGKSNGAA